MNTLRSAAQRRRHAVQRASACNGPITHVPRIAPLDVGTFRALARGGIPFVLVGMVDQWPLATMTPQDLAQQHGAIAVRVRSKDYVTKAFSAQRTMLNLTLAQYLQSLQTDTSDLPDYVGNQEIPALQALCRWPPYFQKAVAPRVWLGPVGTITPLHADYDDNLFAQIWGRKHFTLYPPHCEPFLYTREVNPVLLGSAFDPQAPDFDRYPLARDLSPLECVVQAGELLYLPAGWYHQVRALEFSLSANLWGKDRPLALQTGGY